MDAKMPALLAGWDLIVRDRNETLRDEARRERLVRIGLAPSQRSIDLQQVVAWRPGARAMGGTN